MNNYVVIPTRYLNYTENIVDTLVYDDNVLGIYIYDNGCNDDQKKVLKFLQTVYSKVKVYDAKDKGIYEMWNDGWNTAQRWADLGPKEFNVAFLNDDIYFGPGTIETLADFLRSEDDLGVVCPDYDMPVDAPPTQQTLEYTHGTFGQGGISGFAFMVKGEIDVRFDENLTWWYGDDAAFIDIENAGYKLAKVRGLPLEHAGSLSARRHPEIEEAIQKDMDYFNKKYNESRTRW